MNARAELIARLVERRAQQSDEMSDGARDELERAVHMRPEDFLGDDDDRAFFLLTQALERSERDRARDEMIDDDDAFYDARERRLQRLVASCREALSIDPACLDASLVATLAADREPALTLEALWDLRDKARMSWGGTATGDGWGDVRTRCRLRLDAALAVSCLESGHYRLAATTCRDLLDADPHDHLGARRTCALALARLEDEPALEALAQRFEHHDDAWSHLARTILHYRLDRMPAARRALASYARLVAGSAYALLRPTIIDVYLPDRPTAAPGSFEEAAMAVWEADPIIASMPDFVGWAAEQPGFMESAQAFAVRNGLEW